MDLIWSPLIAIIASIVTLLVADRLGRKSKEAETAKVKVEANTKMEDYWEKVAKDLKLVSRTEKDVLENQVLINSDRIKKLEKIEYDCNEALAELRKKITKLHEEYDELKTRLVEAAHKLGNAEGKAEGRAENKAENKIEAARIAESKVEITGSESNPIHLSIVDPESKIK